jgi:hypothetical protein
MRGEALRGDTIPTLDFEFNIATAFEIIHGNAGKAWKGKALGSRIPLEYCMLVTNIGKHHCGLRDVHRTIYKYTSKR